MASLLLMAPVIHSLELVYCAIGCENDKLQFKLKITTRKTFTKKLSQPAPSCLQSTLATNSKLNFLGLESKNYFTFVTQILQDKSNKCSLKCLCVWVSGLIFDILIALRNICAKIRVVRNPMLRVPHSLMFEHLYAVRSCSKLSA